MNVSKLFRICVKTWRLVSGVAALESRLLPYPQNFLGLILQLKSCAAHLADVFMSCSRSSRRRRRKLQGNRRAARREHSAAGARAEGTGRRVRGSRACAEEAESGAGVGVVLGNFVLQKGIFVFVAN